MWFDPQTLLARSCPPATFATSATFEGQAGAKVAESQKSQPPKLEAGVTTTARVNQLYAEERAAILTWLEHIGEADPDEISHVLEACQLDEQARAWCLEQARQVPPPPEPDYRATCGACRHFQRIDHPNLGHCAKGEPETLAGLWDADRRYCTQYEVGNETLGKPDRAGNKQ